MNTKQHLKAAFVWLDMEMTGLDSSHDLILEIAAVCTTETLEISSPVFHTVLHVSKERLETMNEWCKKTHSDSGLCQAVQNSTITKQEAENALKIFLTEYASERPLLCGNSIWNDRIFLRKHFPDIEQLFHYRMIDVSSIKELIRRWYPDKFHIISKKSDGHRAKEDLEESIKELTEYKNLFFK